MHVECESKRDTSINRGNGNHLKTTQTIPEQHTGKARFRGPTKNNDIGHHTTTLESTNVKIQNIFHIQSNSICNTNCKYRTSITPHKPETVSARYKIVNTLHKGDKYI